MNKIAPIILALAVIWACSPKTTPVVEAMPPAEPLPPAEAPMPPQPAEAPDALSADAIAGQALYDGKCGRCHDLPVVADYSAKRWQEIVPPMARKAKLDATQESQVMAYVLETVGE